MQDLVRTHTRICPLCEACCGLEIKTQGDKVVSIRGHEADVLSKGFICPKGVALQDLHEDPDRLRQPMIRRDGVLVPASWDEAFAEIERRLPALISQHGKQAVAVVAGNPTSHKIGLMLYLPRLVKALGTRHFYSAATLDQIPRHVVSGLMYGHWMTVPIPDIARCQWLMVIGANPLASNGSMWTVPDFKGHARAMQARGGKLLVVDPRRTETAALADEHAFIQPRGDVFLLLGMLHTLFHRGWARLAAAEPWAQGLPALQAAVQAYTPAKMASLCGIDAATIERWAYELAHTPQAAIYGRIGTCTQEFGSLSTWLIDLLNVLSGHLDEPGGVMFPKAAAFAANTAGQSGRGRGVVMGRFHSRVSGAPEVMGEVPIGCMVEEMETAGEGQIKALITVATNPVLSAPNGERLSVALSKLDFMLSLDIYINETSRHADVILPAPSPLEDLHYDVPYPQMSWRNQARFSAPVFERPPGQPAEWQSILRLCAILQGKPHKQPGDIAALDDAYFEEDGRRTLGDAYADGLKEVQTLQGPERLLALALKTGPYGLDLVQVKAAAASGGMDLGPLMPRLPEVLRTPAGCIDLAPPALLQDLRRVDARWAELTQNSPATDAELPYLLIGRREMRSNNSWMHNLPRLARGHLRCTLLIHPDDAGRLGLADGALAQLNNANGQLQAVVSLTTDMMPGVVSLPHGWGHDLPGSRLQVAAQRPGVNMNALLPDDWRDPLSGNAVLSGIPVQVQRV